MNELDNHSEVYINPHIDIGDILSESDVKPLPIEAYFDSDGDQQIRIKYEWRF